jgi:hypothetical protein
MNLEQMFTKALTSAVSNGSHVGTTDAGEFS